MIPAIIYNSFQLMPIIMILAGLVSSSRKSMKEWGGGTCAIYQKKLVYLHSMVIIIMEIDYKIMH